MRMDAIDMITKFANLRPRSREIVVSVYVHAHACVYLCMYEYIYLCMYEYIYTHIPCVHGRMASTVITSLYVNVCIRIHIYS